jgi:hypothetical protein
LLKTAIAVEKKRVSLTYPLEIGIGYFGIFVILAFCYIPFGTDLVLFFNALLGDPGDTPVTLNLTLGTGEPETVLTTAADVLRVWQDNKRGQVTMRKRMMAPFIISQFLAMVFSTLFPTLGYLVTRWQLRRAKRGQRCCSRGAVKAGCCERCLRLCCPHAPPPDADDVKPAQSDAAYAAQLSAAVGIELDAAFSSGVYLQLSGGDTHVQPYQTKRRHRGDTYISGYGLASGYGPGWWNQDIHRYRYNQVLVVAVDFASAADVRKLAARQVTIVTGRRRELSGCLGTSPTDALVPVCGEHHQMHGEQHRREQAKQSRKSCCSSSRSALRDASLSTSQRRRKLLGKPTDALADELLLEAGLRPRDQFPDYARLCRLFVCVCAFSVVWPPASLFAVLMVTVRQRLDLFQVRRTPCQTRSWANFSPL